MVETGVLLFFALMLVGSVATGLPLALPLAAGAVLFANYGIQRGISLGRLARAALRGLRHTAPVLVLFVLIGMLTATWRAAGAIPLITCWSTRVVGPATIVPLAFVACAAMSFLTGSAFGAGATTGVVCVTVGTAMGADAAVLGGAVLSGCFFGDRCSPMSSSAALVASVTGTRVSENLGRMARFAALPALAALCAYAAAGLAGAASGAAADPTTALSRAFALSPVALAPVAVVLALCLAGVSVRSTMLASLAVGLALCVGLQGMDPAELPAMLLLGYRAADPAVAALANGGGVLSMGEVALVVGIASTYSGLFDETGLLDALRRRIERVALRTTPFVGVLLTGALTTAIVCDQVVATMLTSQLCDRCEGAGKALALDLENSTILMPALVPWSSSAVGILAFVGAPSTSVLFAFYAALVPAWTLALSFWERRHPAFVDGRPARALGLDECDDVRRADPAKGRAIRRLAA